MRLKDEVRTKGTLDDATRDAAVRQLATNGYTILENVFSSAQIQQLKTAYHRHFNRFVEETRETNKNGHYRMDLPFEAPFTDESVVANPFVTPIVQKLLGEDCICQYFASNTCMPGSGYQDIHSDLRPLFPESTATMPVSAIVLNIALVDFTQENGPTEIWPGGTHLIPENCNRSAFIKEAAENMHSTHVIMPAGSITLRDLRMWHRGTPNHSNEARPMIALVYFRHWFGAEPLIIPKDAYAQMAESVQRMFRKAIIGQLV